MRYLALDVGDERIGVAISDEGHYLARPMETIRRVSGPSSFLRLAEIVKGSAVARIVVGLPLLEDGTRGKQVRSTESYVAGLVSYVEVPIVYWDERYSTNRASEIISDTRRGRRRTAPSIDAVAAAVILQEYLDSESRGTAS